MAYVFPFTTTGEMNLDWLLNQMKSLGEDYNDFTSKVKNVLAGYSVGIEEFMSWFPEGTFTVTKNTDGIITAVTMAEGALSFEELLAGHLQSYVDAASAQADRAEDAADRATAASGGRFVSYDANQGLTEAQKNAARNNIGLTDSIFQSKNMWLIEEQMRVGRIQDSAFVVQSPAFITSNVQDQSFYYNNTGSNNQETTGAGARIVCPANVKTENRTIPMGTYTITLRVHRKSADVVWPSDFLVGFGLAFNPNGGAVTSAYTPRQEKRHLTAARGEVSGSTHAFEDADSMIGWLRATVNVDHPGLYYGLRIQHPGAARYDGLVYDTIQIEAGSEPSEYVPYGSDMTAVDTTARDRITELENVIENMSGFELETIPDAVRNFILDSGSTELGLTWFSDPHPATAAFESNVKTIVSSMVEHYKNYPSSYLVDGGDWLTSGILKNDAFERMRVIMGMCKDLMPDSDHFIHLPGNHDNNSVSPSDTAIPRGAMSLLYDNGQTYGVIETANTAILCIDTGSTGVSTNTAWAQEEVSFFANYLAGTSKKYVIALAHMAIKGNSGWVYDNLENATFTISKPSEALNEIAMYIMAAMAAMNEGQSWTFNKTGQTYSFPRTTKALFWLSGHDHKSGYGSYLNIPIAICPNNGIKAASGSAPHDFETWMYVVSKITDDIADVFFWLTGGMTGREVRDGAGTKVINEKSMYLHFNLSDGSWVWDPYVGE